MAGELDRKPGPWSKGSNVSISDAEIVTDMINRLELGKTNVLTADSIYTAFQDAKKAADDWIKYYMISVVLLLLAVTGAMEELELFGTKLSTPFVGPASILSFAVCTLGYTNHELKMRLYRAFFEGLLAGISRADRASILLRYPLAYYGGKYLPHESRPDDYMVGLRSILASLPILGVLGIGWLLAVFGLMLLLGYALYGVFEQPDLPPLIKVAVFAFFFGAIMVSGEMLRNPKTKHQYEAK